MNWYQLGKDHFWNEGELLSPVQFMDLWTYTYFLEADWDYDASVEFAACAAEYDEGFAAAWEEHDNQILRTEKPWLFEGFGAASREYVVTRDCIIFSDSDPLYN